MKRKIFIFILVLFFVMLTGCIGNNHNEIDDYSKDIYQLAVEAGYNGTYEEWLETIKGEQGLPGENGKQVLFKVEDGFIKWQYVGDSSWNDLVALTEIKGDTGLSAYDIYKKYNPDYAGSEEEWISDLVNGRLASDIKISLNLNDGQLDDGLDNIIWVKKGETVNLPIPSKSGYMFTGWYTEDGEEFNQDEPLYKDVILQAGWQVTIINDVTIKFRVRSGVVSTALIDRISEFQELYPNINVQMHAVSGNYDDLKNLTLQDINNNIAPDLIIGYPEHLADYYSSGALVNLQQFIDINEIGYSDSELNDFVDQFLNENRGFNEEMPNDLYGLPFQKSSEVLVYNKTFFEELFGTSWETKIPKTWAEYETVGQEIITKLSNGEADDIFQGGFGSYLKLSDYITSGNFVPLVYDSSQNGFITATSQFGAIFTERTNAETGFVRFNNVESKNAMTYFQNLAERHLFATPELFGKNFGSDLFTSIKTVMTISSSAGVIYNRDVHSDYDYEIGIAPVPYYQEDSKLVMSQGTNIAMLNQNTIEERIASWLLMKFLISPVNSAKFAVATGGYVPVFKSSYSTDFYKTYLTNPSLDKIFWSQAANVVYNEYINNNYNFISNEAFVGYSNITREVGDMFESIIVNNYNIVDAFQQSYYNLYPFVESETNEPNTNYDEELRKIYLGDLTNITESLSLPVTTRNGSEITWELVSVDNTASLVENNNTVTLMINPTQYTEDSFGNQNNAWGKAVLKASITKDDVTSTRIWNIFITPGEPSNLKTIYDIKNNFNKDDAVEAMGLVTHVISGQGFFLTDNTGSIFVYGSNASRGVSVGDNVTVTGVVSEYSGMRQIAYPILLENSSGNVISYDNAVVTTIADLLALNTVDKNNFNKLFELEGTIKLIESGGYTNIYLVDSNGSKVMFHYNALNDVLEAEITNYTNKYVSLKAYSFGIYSNNICIAYIQGTIEETTTNNN